MCCAVLCFQDKKTHAMKLGRQTMDKIHSGAAIRPRLVAQVGRAQGTGKG